MFSAHVWTAASDWPTVEVKSSPVHLSLCVNVCVAKSIWTTFGRNALSRLHLSIMISCPHTFGLVGLLIQMKAG